MPPIDRPELTDYIEAPECVKKVLSQIGQTYFMLDQAEALVLSRPADQLNSIPMWHDRLMKHIAEDNHKEATGQALTILMACLVYLAGRNLLKEPGNGQAPEGSVSAPELRRRVDLASDGEPR